MWGHFTSLETSGLTAFVPVAPDRGTALWWWCREGTLGVPAVVCVTILFSFPDSVPDLEQPQ